MGALSPGLEQGFFELRTGGYKPILAHPERHRQLSTSHEQLERLRDQELHFQVNAGSFMGQFGRRAKATAEWLLEKGWVDIVASDGHDLVKRPFSLSSAYKRVSELTNQAEAGRLFMDNPLRAIRGETVDTKPVVSARPNLTAGAAAQGRRTGSVWRRLLGDGE